MSCKPYKVIGVREEQYIGQFVRGHNCDFDYTDGLMFRHVILLKDRYSQKVELTLEESEGECGSGWCSASFGNYKWKEVETFAEKTHKVVKDIELDICENSFKDLDGEDRLITELFSFSFLGGDAYYPSGGYEINKDLLEPIRKGEVKRPVHIFVGGSDLCKSHLASLTGKTVYETDKVSCEEELPEVFKEDIIVVGNRWDVDIETIKSRIFYKDDTNIILVEFSKAN